jgi:hypothetical protein
MTYVRQIMLIGSGSNSIETQEAYGISGEFDMDALAPKMVFNLPYLLPGQYSVSSSQVDITRLKKYDTVKLYYGEFKNDPGNVKTSQLTRSTTRSLRWARQDSVTRGTRSTRSRAMAT